jgi:hypothetical protein
MPGRGGLGTMKDPGMVHTQEEAQDFMRLPSRFSEVKEAMKEDQIQSRKKRSRPQSLRVHSPILRAESR